MSQSGKGEGLGYLAGMQLSAVTFVADYLQLQFDGDYINFYVWPRIRNASGMLERGTPGYRDALCNLIGDKIVEALENPNISLVLLFSRGSSLDASLKAEDRDTVEAVLLQRFQKGFSVW